MLENFIPKPWKILPKIIGAKLHCELKNIDINLDKIKDEYLKILKKENFQKHSSGAFDGGWGAIGLITYGGDPYTDMQSKKKNCYPKIIERM